MLQFRLLIQVIKDFNDILIAARQGGFIVPYIWQLINHMTTQKSHKFRRLPLCSILYFDLMEFSENQDKEVQLGLMLFQSC